MSYLIASNTSAVFIRTQSALGTFANPTTTNEDGSGAALGTYAVRVVGTPKFAPRGAGIIQRTDIYTPFGGGQSAVTGGIGWDITFQTELFWRFDETPGAASQYITRDQSQLSALWLASPWAITLLNTSTDTLLTVQPNFIADVARAATAAANYTAQPFSIAYEEANGKRYEAFDCICIPKISWESGGKILLDWTIKGKWRDVTNSTNQAPTYPEQYAGTAKPQPPLIGQNAAMSLTGFFGPDTNALSKVTVDPGWAINDVMDTRQAYGFGIAFVALTTYPTIAVEVANFAEGTATQVGPPVVPQVGQPDFTAAQANTIYAGQTGSGGVAVGSALTVTISIGTDTIVFTLNLPQLIEWPAPGDANGYRNIGLKFGGIPNKDQTTVMSILFNSVT